MRWRHLGGEDDDEVSRRSEVRMNMQAMGKGDRGVTYVRKDFGRMR